MQIRFEHITKKFKNTTAVKDMDITINDGEMVCLLGPSGCGKSTTLSMVAGLEIPTDGDIFFDGKSMAGVEAEKRDIGMVFQNYALYPHMTVAENIMFPLRMRWIPKAERMEKMRAAAEMMKITEYLKRKPAQLSGGQQQRVAIARALAMHPQMLFFDEPTSALDPELTTEVLKILRQLAEKKMTMVIVTHEIDFARAVSDRVIFMADGYIVEEGAPADVIDNPRNPRTQAFLRKVQR